MSENEQVAGGNRRNMSDRNRKFGLTAWPRRAGPPRLWTKQYGGGLTDDEAMTLEEEVQTPAAGRPAWHGPSMLGPALLECGTEEPRQTHLPPIIRGETRCSEPEAGSDLASLRTRAVLQGKHFTRSAILAAVSTLYGNGNDAASLASLAKAMANETFLLCGNESIQMHGGIGMTDEHEIGFFAKRCRVAQATFGHTAFCRERYANLMSF
jgi:alkylation response protein AidB-like acyl-CoA dehydrogenase